jgi:hypothetical protein
MNSEKTMLSTNERATVYTHSLPAPGNLVRYMESSRQQRMYDTAYREYDLRETMLFAVPSVVLLSTPWLSIIPWHCTYEQFDTDDSTYSVRQDMCIRKQTTSTILVTTPSPPTWDHPSNTTIDRSFSCSCLRTPRPQHPIWLNSELSRDWQRGRRRL